MFVKHLLSACFCSKCYIYNISGDPYYSSMRLVLTLLLTHFTVGKTEAQRGKVMSQVTQLQSVRARIETQATLLHVGC